MTSCGTLIHVLVHEIHGYISFAWVFRQVWKEFTDYENLL